MYKYAGLAALLLLLYAGTSLAMPGAGGGGEDKFAQMDADKDGKVTWAEFSAYYPQMKEAAFEAIDSNHDNGIDRAEWEAFFSGHARDMAGAARPVPGGGMPPKETPGGEEGVRKMPLLPMPGK